MTGITCKSCGGAPNDHKPTCAVYETSTTVAQPSLQRRIELRRMADNEISRLLVQMRVCCQITHDEEDWLWSQITIGDRP